MSLIIDTFVTITTPTLSRQPAAAALSSPRYAIVTRR